MPKWDVQHTQARTCSPFDHGQPTLDGLMPLVAEVVIRCYTKWNRVLARISNGDLIYLLRSILPHNQAVRIHRGRSADGTTQFAHRACTPPMPGCSALVALRCRSRLRDWTAHANTHCEMTAGPLRMHVWPAWANMTSCWGPTRHRRAEWPRLLHTPTPQNKWGDLLSISSYIP